MERILVIDDNEEWVQILRRELEFRCYTVVSAGTVRKGLESARVHEPDLIMVDIEPAGPGGFEIIGQLAADEKTRDIPVAVLSARTNKRYVEQARALGVCDFISKEDFHLGRMLSTVQLALLRRCRGTNSPESADTELVQLKRESGMLFISFHGNITGKRFREQAKSVLNKAFLTRTQKETCVLDLRRVPQMNDLEFQALNSYIRLFGRRDLAIIAGAHFGELCSRDPKSASGNLFLSCGDYMLHAENVQFQAKATAV